MSLSVYRRPRSGSDQQTAAARELGVVAAAGRIDANTAQAAAFGDLDEVDRDHGRAV
jgi:hypothetical protein